MDHPPLPNPNRALINFVTDQGDVRRGWELKWRLESYRELNASRKLSTIC